MRLDEVGRFPAEPRGQVFAVGSVLEPGIAIGREVLLPAVGTAALNAALVHVEPLVLGEKALGAEMPLAREEGGITRLLEGLGHGGLIEREPVVVGRGQHSRVALPLFRLIAAPGADVVGDAGAHWILAGHDAGTGGAAHRAGGIGLREPHAGGS